ncbi:MAG: hypothetical protein AMXMBFR33_31450 [Candidatus Xenobia bacterium]
MASEMLTKAEPKQDLVPMWPDFEQFRTEMQKMMGEMFSRSLWPSMASMQMPAMRPALNLFKENSNLVAELAVPGLAKKDLHITISDQLLTVEGEFKKEEKTKKDQTYVSECYTGKFSRSTRLPAEVNSKKAQAELKDGMLRVIMPLADPGRHETTRIEVK